MHYNVILGETDITAAWILRTLHSTPLGIDKAMVSKLGICECMNYTFPVIRKLELFEIDVLDPASSAFEKELARLGIGGRKLPFIIRKPLEAMLGNFGVKPGEKWEDCNIENVQHRLNSRSFVICKKQDNEKITQDPAYICQKCNKPFPQNWA